MVGQAWYGCKVKSSITTCTIGSPTGKATIRYASKTKSLKLPSGTWTIRKLDGSTHHGRWRHHDQGDHAAHPYRASSLTER